LGDIKPKSKFGILALRFGIEIKFFTPRNFWVIQENWSEIKENFWLLVHLLCKKIEIKREIRN
jgi:hypothetical protein